MLSKIGEITRENGCLEYDAIESKITLEYCNRRQDHQYWTFRRDSQQIYHKSSKLCMGINAENHQLEMQKCETQSIAQKWVFEYTDQGDHIK